MPSRSRLKQALAFMTPAAARAAWAAALACMGVISLAILATLALAQPVSQRVTIIVPYTPGSEPDGVARIMADELQQRRHQSIIVENKEGASGLLGIRDVMHAPPDGATMLMVGPSYTMNASLMKDPGYDPATSLAPVVLCCSGAFVLAVHPSVPAHNLKEFVRYAKAHPGKINYASPGLGTPFHMAMELFADTAKLELTHIPYKGYGGALENLLGGHVSAMFLPLTQGAALVGDGKVRLLAIADDTRSPAASDVPTFAEEGYGGVDVRIWMGLLAPAATPADKVGRINADIADILRSPRGVERLAKQRLRPVAGTSNAFKAFLADDTQKWRRVVTARHIEKH